MGAASSQGSLKVVWRLVPRPTLIPYCEELATTSSVHQHEGGRDRPDSFGRSFLADRLSPGTRRPAGPASPCALAHVYARAALRVGLGLAEHFAGDRGDLALAEEEEAQEVGERASLGPLEVDVWLGPGRVADVQQEGGQRVGHRGAVEGEDAVAVVQ